MSSFPYYNHPLIPELPFPVKSTHQLQHQPIPSALKSCFLSCLTTRNGFSKGDDHFLPWGSPCLLHPIRHYHGQFPQLRRPWSWPTQGPPGGKQCPAWRSQPLPEGMRARSTLSQLTQMKWDQECFQLLRDTWYFVSYIERLASSNLILCVT